jgi:uncharacterized protein (DUF433 family)
MELLSPTSRWYPYVSVDSEKLGGDPVFRGTRVPVRVLFEFLNDGDSLEEFLEEFEGVPRESAIAILTLLSGDLTDQLRRDLRKDLKAA